MELAQTKEPGFRLESGMRVAQPGGARPPLTLTRQVSMHDAGSMPHETEPPVRYLFIVARNRPDILEQVKQRLRGDARIEVIVDRRHGERRQSGSSREPDRRRLDRRRPVKYWDDLSLFPTLVVQSRVPSYAELQQQLIVSTREAEALREESLRLRAEIASLESRLETLVSADVAFKADAVTLLTQAGDAVAALMATLRALGRHAAGSDPSRRPSEPSNR
jgi:hypothetical protein